MKTTVEVADVLLAEARAVAAKEGTTVRALLEEGLRKALEGRRKKARAFRLRFVTFRGDGLQDEAASGGWERIRDLLYQGRGA